MSRISRHTMKNSSEEGSHELPAAMREYFCFYLQIDTIVWFCHKISSQNYPCPVLRSAASVRFDWRDWISASTQVPALPCSHTWIFPCIPNLQPHVLWSRGFSNVALWTFGAQEVELCTVQHIVRCFGTSLMPLSTWCQELLLTVMMINCVFKCCLARENCISMSLLQARTAPLIHGLSLHRQCLILACAVLLESLEQPHRHGRFVQ